MIDKHFPLACVMLYLHYLLCIFLSQSSLLSTILGELPQDKGVVKVTGNLTYASQQPWMYPGTIRSNILFGKELQPQRYEKVLKACALKKVWSLSNIWILFEFLSLLLIVRKNMQSHTVWEGEKDESAVT